jgi:hypothetical protein
MKRLTLTWLLLAWGTACSTPATAPIFETDPAIGPFALDPSSPVISRGPPGALDEFGATAPSVYSDAKGVHAVYLGFDSDGGSHLLGADQLGGGADGGTLWQKQLLPAVVTTSPVGRPAAVEIAGQLQVFYDSFDASNNPVIVSTITGGASIAGASGPCVVQIGGQLQIYALKAADQAIHQYLSADGVQPFIDMNAKAVLAPSDMDGGFDAFAVSAPTIQIETSSLGRTLYRMWYTGTDAPGGTVSIGLAGSFDGVTFERYTENPVRFHGDVASVYALGGDAGYQMLYSQTPFAAPTDISLADGPVGP